MYYFWKLVYAIKYWRVFFQPKDIETQAAEPGLAAQRERPSIATRVVIFLFFIVPFLMAAGSGLVFWNINTKLRDQKLAARQGVQISATMEALKVQRFKNRSVGPDRTAVKDTEICHVAFRYIAPGSQTITRKQMELTYMTLCERYKKGSTVQALLLPGETSKVIFPEDSIAGYWWWISLAMFLAFASLALLLLRAVTRRRSMGN